MNMNDCLRSSSGSLLPGQKDLKSHVACSRHNVDLVSISGNISTSSHTPRIQQTTTIKQKTKQKIKHNRTTFLHQNSNQSKNRMANITKIIDQRVAGRVGFPILPVYPVEDETYQGSDEGRLEEVTTKVKDILEQHNIPLIHLMLVWRNSCGAAASDRQLTLVITSENQQCDQYQQHWVDAVAQIRSLLLESEIYWSIELIDGRPRQTEIIESTETVLIANWNKALPDFLAKIEDKDWVAVDVLRCGYSTDKKMHPTVMVSARDANDSAGWETTLPALRQVLQNHDVDAKVELRFNQGLDLHTAEHSRTEPDPEVQTLFYERPDIYMGTSCGTSGSDRSGTLGGGIQLQKGFITLKLGLTNYHVLKDGFATQDDLSDSFPPSQSYGEVTSPSDKDHEIRNASLEKALREVEHICQDLEKKLETLGPDERLRKRLYRWNSNLLNLKRDRAEEQPSQVGPIYAASGFRSRDNPRFLHQSESDQHKDWALDWGLFKVNNEDSISSQLMNVPERGYDHILRNVVPTVTQYCTISTNKNYNVAKRGRTTGWTNGRISAINSVVRFSNKKISQEEWEYIPENERIPTSQRIMFQDMFASKPVFVHTIVGLNTNKSLQFLEAGDSGSFVILNQSSNIEGLAIVGLGFSGNKSTLASYMMPFDLLVEDIEEVTGGRVIQPYFAGKLN
ncbi:hypothetical protein BS50DRAFT_584352 [Corynespora cassiicola Philippines]|uniref:Uncharacterized protein n=1 Tax=Corynespora cassiicola Philippines TaxID=1448308 RepID=A0A2T2NZB5_CORCC|nr:hypothetical protein BS50DRAFT_584352 [Corynespora cassiicola Philippines]